jgi:hypothetical protein
MDTSYVAVGTVMSMITDSLTCRPQKSPAGAGPGPALSAVLLGPHKAALGAPAIHAAQHKRAGRTTSGKRGRLYRWPAPSQASQRHRPSYTVSPAGQHLKRGHPAVWQMFSMLNN